MPTRISGLRIGRSYLDVNGVEAATQELDFQLAVQEGIEIVKIVGSFLVLTEAAGTAMVDLQYVQTLHGRVGTLEVVPLGILDAVQLDSEIPFRQDVTVLAQEGGATGGGAGLLMSPASGIDYNEMFFARNLTHRAEGLVASWRVGMSLSIYYYFVKFSLEELGVIFARRA